MGKMIGLVILTIAALKGDIHSSREYAINNIFGIVVGFLPWVIVNIPNITEIVKLISSILALILVSISLHRAIKFKDK